VWELDRFARDLDAPPAASAGAAGALPETILVPFAIESALSGVRNLTAASYAWYRRNFTLPSALRPAGDGGRLLLHFEAVD
jgi:hypothetical protein